MLLLIYLSFGSDNRKLLVMALFPVPVGPTRRSGLFCIVSLSRKYFCFSVSIVVMINSFIFRKRNKQNLK